MRTYRFTEATLAILLLSLLAMPACAALTTPTGIYGYVTLDGLPASGAAVSLSDGQMATTNSAGYYDFTSGVNNGSAYHITASLNGYDTTTQFTAKGKMMEIDLSISTRVNRVTTGITYYVTSGPISTPVPTESPTIVPVITKEPQPTPYEIEDTVDMGHETETTGNPIQLLAGLALLIGLSIIGYYILLKGERHE